MSSKSWYWRLVWSDAMVGPWKKIDTEPTEDALKAWLVNECQIEEPVLERGAVYDLKILSLYPGGKPEYQFILLDQVT